MSRRAPRLSDLDTIDAKTEEGKKFEVKGRHGRKRSEAALRAAKRQYRRHRPK